MSFMSKKRKCLVLVLCVCLLCTSIVSAYAVDTDVEYDELSVVKQDFLERLETDPDDVSFDELSELMNTDLEFTVDVYEKLSELSVEVDCECELDSDVSAYSLVSDAEDSYQIYDFATGTVVEREIVVDDIVVSHSISTTANNDREPTFAEGICKLFVRSPDNKYFAASGFRVGTRSLLTCAHAVYSVLGSTDASGIVTWKSGTWASEVLVVPGYVGGLDTTVYDDVTNRPQFSLTNCPYGMSSASIQTAYMPTEFAELRSETYNDPRSCVPHDWAFLKMAYVANTDAYFNVKSYAQSKSDSFGFNNLCLVGYPGVYNYNKDVPAVSPTPIDSPWIQSWCSQSQWMQRLLYVDKPSYGGMSGGPLFDKDSYAVGIIHGVTHDGKRAMICDLDQNLIDLFVSLDSDFKAYDWAK